MRAVVLFLSLICASAAAQEPWRGDLSRALELARSKETQAALAALDAAFQAGFDDGQQLLLDPTLRSLRKEPAFRSLMRTHCKAGPLTLVSADEPGEHLVVRGLVLDDQGKPAKGVLVYVFHAAEDVDFADEIPADGSHLPIFGYLRSSESGVIELRTIRPGAYPERTDVEGPGRYIPRHLNLEVTNWTGVVTRVQVVFDDDPRLSHPHWRELAKRAGHPIAKVQKQQNGELIASFELRLKG